ncbi:Bug family tripartite tricarboxylate transporter substrate binding protein [Bordetella sp. 2513F-2]
MLPSLRSRLARLARIAAAIALPWIAAASHAAGDYPSRPITLVVSYPPGGSVDVAARILQEPLSRSLGQPLVIENRGGAGGTIATRHVAEASPDGYTLLITLSSHTINPAIYRDLPFDTLRDFSPVSLVASAPQVLVANPAFPADTLPGLIAYARSQGQVPYGSAGTGSPSHIAGELLRLRTSLPLMHVPYRGGGPATVDVLSGQIPLLWVSLPSVTSHIRQGRLKALAVSTRQRTPVLPDVPAVGETVPDFNVDSWYAVFAPAGTPPAVVARVQSAIAAAARDPAVQAAFLAQGAVAVGSSSEELERIVRTEVPAWNTLARQAGIAVQ